MTNLIQTAPPVLSTSDTHIFEDPTPRFKPSPEARLSDQEIWSVYEIERTAGEITQGGWRRVALQFPDFMLGDAVRVFEGLQKELARLLKTGLTTKRKDEDGDGGVEKELETSFNGLSTASKTVGEEVERHRLHILADTSYGACCVDEIAAEHVDAQVVVHYGRSCLSPTARLPVIYVFTSRLLSLDTVIQVFGSTYEERGKDEKIILMADIVYQSHIESLRKRLEDLGYTHITTPEIIHDPSSIVPNRKVEGISEEEMKQHSLFHISDPAPALLLTLNSRVKDLFIYPTTTSPNTPDTSTTTPTKAIQQNTTLALRRRYALLTSLSTSSIFGILINTLSVSHYLSTVTALQKLIARAGKKSYTFVVGKVNAAKMANFAEIGGWVVVGCWESSLVDSSEFLRPLVTPFELRLALVGDNQRIWTGEWRGDFAGLENGIGEVMDRAHNNGVDAGEEGGEDGEVPDGGALDSEEESEPPEFDFRTGRYISHSRPMRKPASNPISSPLPSTPTPETAASNVLTRRAKGELATINGAVSPGAEYLRSARTWTGLGSDFHEGDAETTLEVGRSGVARGYTVGEDGQRR